MRLLFISVIIFLVSSCKSENKPQPVKIVYNNKDLDKVVTLIAEENVIGDNIGIAGSPYRFELYQKLNKIASSEELIYLTDYQNPSVRYYAFRALANRRNSVVYNLLVKHINDTARLTCFYGCSGMEETVVHNLLNVVYSSYVEPSGYRLTPSQEKVIDSLLKIYPDPLFSLIQPAK